MSISNCVVDILTRKINGVAITHQHVGIRANGLKGMVVISENEFCKSIKELITKDDSKCNYITKSIKTEKVYKEFVDLYEEDVEDEERKGSIAVFNANGVFVLIDEENDHVLVGNHDENSFMTFTMSFITNYLENIMDKKIKETNGVK